MRRFELFSVCVTVGILFLTSEKWFYRKSEKRTPEREIGFLVDSINVNSNMVC